MLDKMGHGLVLTGKVTDSRVFILTREAAVVFNICTKNSGELMFKALFSHGILAVHRIYHTGRGSRDFSYSSCPYLPLKLLDIIGLKGKSL
jgi:hypothetical protein